MSWRAELPSETLDKIIWEQPWDVQRTQRQIPVLAGIGPCSSTGSGKQARRQLLGRPEKPGGWKHWSKPRERSPSWPGDQQMWCVHRGSWGAQGAQDRPYHCLQLQLPGGRWKEEQPSSLCTAGKRQQTQFLSLKTLDLSVMHYRLPAGE